MSSQSRKRFSKILDIGSGFISTGNGLPLKSHNCIREPALKAVEESPVRKSVSINASLTPVSPLKNVSSLDNGDLVHENDIRSSETTSHDKSTVASLLEKHIECLGLQPEFDERSVTSEGVDHQQSSTMSAFGLTDAIATIPSGLAERPMTSPSRGYPSVATIEKRTLKPRRLFASMDARVPGTIKEQDRSSETVLEGYTPARPSYGWQTLPSSSDLRLSSLEPSTLASGVLADVDTTDSQPRFRLRSRSGLVGSTSNVSQLTVTSSKLTKSPQARSVRERPRSEVLARQESHQRRRRRIRLRLKTRSQTTGDLLDTANNKQDAAEDVHRIPWLRNKFRTESVKSPVEGYAELSGESMPASQNNLVGLMSRPPLIPARWSSIIAAMPQPRKPSIDVGRKTSIRSHRSQRSNTSVVEPINSTRLRTPVPRSDSVPRLAPPEFGPPLTSSEFNLSIPFADIPSTIQPSTIRPTLRETKSFFSDDSSARRQRNSLRQRLHLNGLRNLIPSSAGTSMIAQTPRSQRLNISHSCQLKGHGSHQNKVASPSDTVAMTDFAYRKRKMLERLKEWWRRQCLQKVVSGRRKRDRFTQNTVAW
jgi:hypothetical protein